MRKRGFEVARGFEKAGINLPIQSTKTSAGFDFEAAEDTEVPPLWLMIAKGVSKMCRSDGKNQVSYVRPIKVATGIKSYMQEDEFLALYNRSSNPVKKLLFMADGAAVCDEDYYQNPQNDGHITFQFLNFGILPVYIKKGDRIGQGVFQKYLSADEGKCRKGNGIRNGGFGSTGT